MDINSEHIERIVSKLVQDDKFITRLMERMAGQQSMTNIQLGRLIDEISQLLDRLIHQKIEKQMCELIDDNNRILQQISNNLSKNNNSLQEKQFENKHDASFSDIHKLINEQKKKALEGMNDADIEKSISVMEKYEEKYGDVADKMMEIQHKIRSMEDKYQTGFKSLWNVLSMTESAFFDHIKQCKWSKEKENQLDVSVKSNDQKSQPFFKFWK